MSDSADHIVVTFSTVSGAADDVRAAAGRIRTQLDDLRVAVARAAATWRGAARDAYRARQAEWDTAAADLQAVLTKISAALAAAAEDYRATEAANVRLWE